MGKTWRWGWATLNCCILQSDHETRPWICHYNLHQTLLDRPNLINLQQPVSHAQSVCSQTAGKNMSGAIPSYMLLCVSDHHDCGTLQASQVVLIWLGLLHAWSSLTVTEINIKKYKNKKTITHRSNKVMLLLKILCFVEWSTMHVWLYSVQYIHFDMPDI